MTCPILVDTIDTFIHQVVDGSIGLVHGPTLGTWTNTWRTVDVLPREDLSDKERTGRLRAWSCSL